MNTLAKLTLKGVTWTTLSVIVRNIISLLQIIVLARILAKEDFGLMASASVFIGFTSLFLDMGISYGILHKQKISKNEYSSLYWLNIFTGIVIFGIILLFAPVYAKLNTLSEELMYIIRLLSVTVVFSALGSQHRIVRQKEMRFKQIAFIDISTAIISMITAVILAKKGAGVYSIVFATLAGSISSGIIYLFAGLIKDKNIDFHFNLRETFPFLRIGVFQIGATVLSYLFRQLDILFIGTFYGNETLGIYSLSKKIIMTVYGTINPVFTKVLTPLFAKMQYEKDRLKEVYLKLIGTLCIINFPVYFLISVFSFAILLFLYGSQYTEGHSMLSLLALYYGALTISNPISSLQISLGRTDIGFYWTIYVIAITSVTLYISSFFNIETMLILLIILAIFNTVMMWKVQIYSMIKMPFKEYIAVILKPFLIALTLSVPLYLFLYKSSAIWIISIASLSYGLLYFFIIKKTMKNSYFAIAIDTFFETIKEKFYQLTKKI